MELFIAILLSDSTREQLFALREQLRECSLGGNFTRLENLHLTLISMGEISRADMCWGVKKIGWEDKIRRVLEQLEEESFQLVWKEGLGSTYHRDGDTYWLMPQQSDELYLLGRQLSRGLHRALRGEEDHHFFPHLTLGRQVLMPPEFDPAAFGQELPKITEQVKAVSLVKSERVDGQPTYTELYSKKLKDKQPSGVV